MRTADAPLPNFTGVEIERRREQYYEQLRDLRSRLYEVQVRIVQAAVKRKQANREDGKNESYRNDMLALMRAEDVIRRALEDRWTQSWKVYEDLVFLNAVALLYYI
jgi:hypothetical protein